MTWTLCYGPRMVASSTNAEWQQGQDALREEPSSRAVDCYISADPVAILLVAWGRES